LIIESYKPFRDQLVIWIVLKLISANSTIVYILKVIVMQKSYIIVSIKELNIKYYQKLLLLNVINRFSISLQSTNYLAINISFYI
jgi:hypothetical protein